MLSESRSRLDLSVEWGSMENFQGAVGWKIL